MRLIVTGATGFIGKHLVASAKHYFEVICLTRSMNEQSEHKNVRFVQTNYDLDSLKSIFLEDDVLIHLAGQRLTKTETNPRLTSFIEPNVKLTENLLIAACEARIRQVILASSIGVYSKLDDKPYSEDIVTNPGTIYGLSKLVGEQLVNHYCMKNSVKSTILRLSQCFGVGEKDSPVLMKFIRTAKEKQKISVQDNEFYLDEIYVKDVVDIIMLSIEKQKAGTFNVGGGKAYSILEMAKLVNLTFDNVDNIEIIPNEKVNNKDNFLSIQKAEEELDWSPKFNLDKALVDMKENYNITEG